jgi:hypothetical protein
MFGSRFSVLIICNLKVELQTLASETLLKNMRHHCQQLLLLFCLLLVMVCFIRAEVLPVKTHTTADGFCVIQRTT